VCMPLRLYSGKGGALAYFSKDATCAPKPVLCALPYFTTYFHHYLLYLLCTSYCTAGG
jgi:hypothetical protein